jgi:hypothetical protein
MLQHLYEKLKKRDPNINLGSVKNSRIRCFPHIVNIVTQHMLKALDSGADGDESPVNSDTEDSNDMPFLVDITDNDNDSEQEEDVIVDNLPPPGIISKIRRLVKWIHQSSQRMALLERVIAMGNTGRLWKDANGNVVEIKPRALIHDVKTRWDSTFLMIRRILEFRQVCIIYLQCYDTALNRMGGQPFKHIKGMLDDLEARAMAPYISAEEGWDHAEAIVIVLQV